MRTDADKKRNTQAMLEQEPKSFPTIFDNSPDILLFVVDVDSVIVRLHGAVYELIGFEKEAMIGKKYQTFIVKEDVQQVENLVATVLVGETHYAKYRLNSKDGTPIPIDVTLTPIIGRMGEVIGFYGLTHNISTETQLERKNQELAGKFESIVESTHENIGFMDAQGMVTFQSEAIEPLLGYTAEEVIGRHSLEFIHPEDIPAARKIFRDVLLQPNKPYTTELRFQHKNGSTFYFRVLYTNLMDTPSIRSIVYNLEDITEIKEKELKIRHLAYHDYLTGLPNRRAFNDQLNEDILLAQEDEEKFAVLIFNLNGFKFLNDTYGYSIGDNVLREVARRLSRELASDVVMIARTGGDEFAMVTRNVQTNDEVEHIAQAALRVFEGPLLVNNYQLFVTARIGASIYDHVEGNGGSLMKNADLAAYLAKKAGYHTYHIFSPSANVELNKLFTLRNSLQHALHNDQFLVYYQPIIHGKTKRVIAVEALLRWDHPELGLVSPNDFIPLAEESGLITKIGEWVIRTVAKKLREWHDAGYEIKASVNLSLIQFLQADLVEIIRDTLEENELDPIWLIIEITETAMVEQKTRVLEKITKIRALGIEIALDDFGEGYASFKNLKDIKPDYLKIDRSLVKDIPADQDSVDMVTTIIQLAHRMKIAVVAEGVETKEQMKLLTEIECERLQGYLFSKPVRAEEIERLLCRIKTTDTVLAPVEKRRADLRLSFPYPLEGLMTIATLNGVEIELENTDVLIENISLRGLRFLSTFQLPLHSDLLLKIQTTFADEEVTYYGKVVHDSHRGVLNRYGIKFVMDDPDRATLGERLDQLETQLKKDPLLEGYPFVTENVFAYFK